MATTTDKISYGTSTAITITAPASSATAGQCGTAVDNGTNFYDDALVTVQVVFPNSATANDKGYYIYVYGSEDGTNYNISTNEMASPGTNAACTPDVPTNLLGPLFMSTISQNKTYTTVFSVAQFFGGVMPRKWGIVLRNYSGQTATTLTCSYTGIYYTNS
jgi:hypothetical protein